MKPLMHALYAALVALLVAESVVGQSSFDSSQENVARKPLAIYGGQQTAIRLASNGNLYVGLSSPNGVFCSTDGAQTWNAPPAGSNLGSNSELVLGETPNTVYALSGVSLYKSSDDCATFTELTGSQGLPNNYGRALAYAHGILLVSARNGSVDRSTDNGSTFSNVVIDAESQDVSALAASPNAGEFYALVRTSLTTKLYKSTTLGSSWTYTGKSGSFDRLGINPGDGNMVIVMEQTRVDISTDGGQTFTLLTNIGAPWGGGVDFITMNDATQRIYIGEQWTSDLGATWHSLNNEAASKNSNLQGHIVQDPANPTTFYMGSDRGVAKSTDNQLNWVDSVQGMLGTQIYALAQGTNKNIFYIGTRYGYAKSTNYLDTTPTWQYPLTLGNTQGISTIRAAAIDPLDDSHVLMSGNDNKLFVTTDGGSTWSPINTPALATGEQVRSIVFGPSGTVYAGFCHGGDSHGGVITSGDNGATWQTMSLPNSPCVNSVVLHKGMLFAGVGAEFVNDATKRGIYRYASSTWTQLGSSVLEQQMVVGLASNGTNLYAAAGDVSKGGLFRTKDDGETWENLGSLIAQSRCTRSVTVDPQNLNDIYASTGCPAGNGTVFLSRDGGDTWATHYQGLRDEVPTVMLIDDLVAGLNTGAFKFDPTATPTATPSPSPSATPSFSVSATIRRANGGAILKGTVKDGTSQPVKNVSVVPLYAKKRQGNFSSIGKARRTNKNGVVEWVITRNGFYRVRLKSSPETTSTVVRLR